MVLLESKAPELGFCAPDFTLESVDAKTYSLKDFSGSKALLIAFICNHCPYVRAIEDRLIQLNREFSKEDFQLVGICSNDASKYPDDSPEQLRKRWHEKNYGFVYLIDRDQNIAKNYGAVCTPDMFLFDQDRRLFYHGRIDDNWRDFDKVRTRDMKNAIEAILQGKLPPAVQKPSMGCSIKWK